MIRVLVTDTDHQTLLDLLHHHAAYGHPTVRHRALAVLPAVAAGQPHTAPTRAGDPATSHAAAASIPTGTRAHNAILDVLSFASPLTDEQLVSHIDLLSPSRVRTARNDLHRAGKLRRHPEDGTTRSGRKAARWEVAP